MAPIALTGNLGTTTVLLHRGNTVVPTPARVAVPRGSLPAQGERHAVRWAHLAIPVADRAGTAAVQ